MSLAGLPEVISLVMYSALSPEFAIYISIAIYKMYSVKEL